MPLPVHATSCIDIRLVPDVCGCRPLTHGTPHHPTARALMTIPAWRMTIPRLFRVFIEFLGNHFYLLLVGLLLFGQICLLA